MERGSDKVGPRADEELKEQPDADRAPDGTLHGGVPAGMSGEDLWTLNRSGHGHDPKGRCG